MFLCRDKHLSLDEVGRGTRWIDTGCYFFFISCDKRVDKSAKFQCQQSNLPAANFSTVLSQFIEVVFIFEDSFVSV